MSKVLYYPIMYLDDNDFKGDRLVLPNNIQNEKNVVVMLQTSWCPHCTNAKPAFQKFAEDNPSIICATIQSDGDTEAEKKLGNRIQQIVPEFRGYPDYCLFVKGKRDSTKTIKSRDIQGLIEFANL